MLHSHEAKRLWDDALSATILLGLCVVIVCAPIRANEDQSATRSTIPASPAETTSPASNINSMKYVATQGEFNELTD
ncbi:MAG: hypothetical protein ABJZ55_25655 [Fuerstiella sp.]